MAFTSTISPRKFPIATGDRSYTQGTFANASGSDIGGDVDTGLKVCESIFFSVNASAIVTAYPVVNETLPAAGDAVTIVTLGDQDGTWMAWGY